MISEICFFLWYLISIWTKYVDGSISMCLRQDGADRIVMFCCNNHQEINGRCEECRSGFTSKDGAPCLPCIVGRWGPKCTRRCRCDKHQRYGIDFKCDRYSGDFGSTLNIPDSTHNYLNEQGSTRNLQNVTTEKQFFGDVTSNAVLYMIPVGCAFTLSVILGSLCICLKMNVCKKFSTFFSRSVQQSQNQQLESVYDLIDETAMDVENIRIENNIIVEVINSTKGRIALSLETEVSQQEKSLYENVYQSLNTHPKKSNNTTSQLERRLNIKPSEKEESSDTDEELHDKDGYLKPICDKNSSSMNGQEKLENNRSNDKSLRLDTIAVEGYVIMEQPVPIPVQRTNPHFFFECV